MAQPRLTQLLQGAALLHWERLCAETMQSSGKPLEPSSILEPAWTMLQLFLLQEKMLCLAQRAGNHL